MGEVYKMLVFHGGLTIQQVEKLKNGDPVIYDKVPYERAYAPGRNTFDYVPIELYKKPIEEFRKYISEDCYAKQYIYFAKYLYACFDFCINCQKMNYIMVCDIAEDILNNYIGVGDYCHGDYRIEYRLPRKIITPKMIQEFLFFEPYNKIQMREFYEKYKDHYRVPKEESENAMKLIRQKGLHFNRDKIHN